MEVASKTEAHILGYLVVDLLKDLSNEQRSQAAIDIIDRCLFDPYEREYQAHEQKVIDELRLAGIRIGHTDLFTYDLTNDQIRKLTEFRERMSSFKSSREQRILASTKDTVPQDPELVTEIVVDNPDVQRAYDQVRARIEASFSCIAQVAIVEWFKETFGHAAFKLPSDTVSMTKMLEDLSSKVDEIKQRLWRTVTQEENCKCAVKTL